MKTLFVVLAFVVACFRAKVASASLLEKESYETLAEIANGKTVFVKFFAPWCGHCKRMASAWEKLTKDWEESKVGLVTEVDCTNSDIEEVCEFFGIKTFPTLMYGTINDLKKYSGDRSYDALSKFANENLVPMCSSKNLSLCNEKTKQQIQDLSTKNEQELKDLIGQIENKLNEIEETFQSQVDSLERQYKEFEKGRDEAIAAMKNENLLPEMISALEQLKGAPEQSSKDEL